MISKRYVKHTVGVTSFVTKRYIWVDGVEKTGNYRYAIISLMENKRFGS